MKTDEVIQADVSEELSWDPQVDSASIGVAVRDGAVTLTGRVPSYRERHTAVKAAERVHGVRSVADEVTVDLPGVSLRDDTDVATSVAHVLDYNTSFPEGAVKASVENGWVTVEGQVDWPYQSHAAEKAIRHIRGVRGVTNLVSVRSRAAAFEVQDAISAALSRNATIDARSISADVRDGNVVLRGHVHSLQEERVAERAAWAAPGVNSVESQIDVRP